MPPAQVVSVSGDVYVACQNGRVQVDGRPVRIIRGRTYAHADSWIVSQRPHMWRPVVLDFPPNDKPTPMVDVTAVTDTEPVHIATAPPTDEDGWEIHEPPPKPAAKEVRAWAKAEGVDVPSRGPIPDDVFERFVKANETED